MVLVTKGTGGDLFPFLRVGRALEARGHEVVLLSHWYHAERVGRAGLRFAPLDDPAEVPQYEEQTTVNPQHRRNALADQVEFVANHAEAGRPAPRAPERQGPKLSLFGLSLDKGLREFRAIAEQCAGGAVLVANYIAFLTARPVAERLGVPFVSVFMSPGFIPDWILNLPFFDELYGHVGADLNRVREEVGLAPVSDWRRWLVTADCFAGMWPDWFAPARPGRAPEIVPVGFAVDDVAAGGELPEELRGVLDPREPPVLITHGTSIPTRADFFEVAAEACGLAGLRGLLVCKFAELIPPALPPGVKWFDFLPFGRLMPHVSCIVHHAGIGTSAQALASGIPQLVMAQGHDRAGSARCLAELGIAETFSPLEWQAERVAAALRRSVESSPLRRRCAELAQRLRGADAVTRACEVFEEFIPGAGAREAAAPAASVEAPREGEGRGAGPKATHGLLANLSPAQRALLSKRLQARLASRAEVNSLPAD
jgi:UDP:flavonoid glycosyltransferase YjiC (YdhE family)